MQKPQKIIEQLLNFADVKINGSNPWDIQVHDSRFYERVLVQTSLGLGESYMDRWWDCLHLDDMIFRVLNAGLEEHSKKDLQFLWAIIRNKLLSTFTRLVNLQSHARAYVVGEKHYDIGNDLFYNMLDPRLNYSCGYWKNSTNLAQAQEAKLKLCCEKLQLKPGMQVLDIGCGWGAFSKYAAENYGVSVTGITISKQQYDYAVKSCQGLPVEIKLQDYRLMDQQFDRICSIGMFEHVGYKNYREYMRVAHRCLKDSGLFLLHTIGNNYSMTRGEEWMNKYIFPNGMLPSIKQIGKAIEKLFVMEDWHNFGADYDKTVLAWHENFNQAWPTLKDKYSERFYRMWNYYLLSCAGACRAREMQLWQIVLSKKGVAGGYQAPR